MTEAIRIDPKTGLKVFNTRAAKLTAKIDGKGYSEIEDESLTTLPPPPPGAVFNAAEQAKYREFKEARAGAADYMEMEGEFSRYLEDVYSEPPVEREALDDEEQSAFHERIEAIRPPLSPSAARTRRG